MSQTTISFWGFLWDFELETGYYNKRAQSKGTKRWFRSSRSTNSYSNVHTSNLVQWFLFFSWLLILLLCNLRTSSTSRFDIGRFMVWWATIVCLIEFISSIWHLTRLFTPWLTRVMSWQLPINDKSTAI